MSTLPTTDSTEQQQLAVARTFATSMLREHVLTAKRLHRRAQHAGHPSSVAADRRARDRALALARQCRSFRDLLG